MNLPSRRTVLGAAPATAAALPRHEVTGMRTPAGGGYLEWLPGQTWRTTCAMDVPSSPKATTGFTRIVQMKQPGNGTSPTVVQPLRRAGQTLIDVTRTVNGTRITVR